MTSVTLLSPQKPSLFVRILKALMSRLGRVSVSGAEHLEGACGKIVVCNHVGWVDPLWMGYAVLPRTLHQMAKKELFSNPVSAWFVRSGGGFPVDRSRPSPATIKHTIALVAQGELVLIFPGGTRSSDGDTNARRGAATIALRGNAQIVPAHYDGPPSFRFSHLFRRPLIHITFGAPISTGTETATNKSAALQLTADLDQVMKNVAAQAKIRRNI